MEENEDSGSKMAATMHVQGLLIMASDIAAATTKDPIIAQIYQYVLEGWPCTEGGE